MLRYLADDLCRQAGALPTPMSRFASRQLEAELWRRRALPPLDESAGIATTRTPLPTR